MNIFFFYKQWPRFALFKVVGVEQENLAASITEGLNEVNV